jgi:hypothetical protein
MAGLVPAIHAFDRKWQDVDARNRCGHDIEDYVASLFSNVVTWGAGTVSPQQTQRQRRTR